jgi:hypothetical protein
LNEIERMPGVIADKEHSLVSTDISMHLFQFGSVVMSAFNSKK